MESFPTIEDQARIEEIHQAVMAFLATLKPRDGEAPMYWYLTPEDARACVDRLVEVRPDTTFRAVLGWLLEVAGHDLVGRCINEAWFRSARDRLQTATDEIDRLLRAPSP